MRDNLITTLPYVDREYRVKFDVFPTFFISSWGSVIHFTAHGGDLDSFGDRIPAVFFFGTTPTATSDKLHICSAVTNQTNYCHSSNSLFGRDQWITVEIAQTKAGNYYNYTIMLNRNVVHSITNYNAQQFYRVKVYVGDPFYNPQPGFIRNLTVDGEFFLYVLSS